MSKHQILAHQLFICNFWQFWHWGQTDNFDRMWIRQEQDRDQKKLCVMCQECQSYHPLHSSINISLLRHVVLSMFFPGIILLFFSLMYIFKTYWLIFEDILHRQNAAIESAHTLCWDFKKLKNWRLITGHSSCLSAKLTCLRLRWNVQKSPLQSVPSPGHGDTSWQNILERWEVAMEYRDSTKRNPLDWRTVIRTVISLSMPRRTLPEILKPSRSPTASLKPTLISASKSLSNLSLFLVKNVKNAILSLTKYFKAILGSCIPSRVMLADQHFWRKENIRLLRTSR